MSSFGLWYQYAGTRPHSPQAADGRIYALNTHGDYVYLTASERLTLWGTQGLAAALFVAAVLLDRRKSRKSVGL